MDASGSHSSVAALAPLFEVAPGYLNTPTAGIPPRPVVDALASWTRAWAGGGITGGDMDPAVDASREAFASLAGVRPEAVAIGSAVSGLLAPIASAFPAGTRVLTAEREFTSVSWPFAACGHAVTAVPLSEVPARAGEHDVVAVSVAQSADGALVDLEALRAATAGTDTVVVLDATQSLGWLPADLSWADAVAAAGYKWLLAPRGCAWLAISDELLARVIPSAAGWYAGESRWDATYGLPLRLASGARRLDVSPAWPAFAGAGVSLPWVAALDRDAVHGHGVGLAGRVRAALGLPPSPSPIVSIPRPEAPGRLAEAGIRSASRAGAARIGFHLHNTQRDVDLVLEALDGA